jgi:uncharacterized protein YecE (DUF72 family)
MPRLHIGKRSLEGRLDKYAQRFDLVEVRPDVTAALRPATLQRWRASVSGSFVFSVVLPQLITELRPGRATDEALEFSLETARLLQASVIVIATPISITPTAANRKRLEALVTKLPHDVVRLAWEPSGIWELEDAQAVAASLGVILVADAAREQLPPGPIAYTRLRGLGDARRLSADRLDRVISNLRGRRDAFVVIETDQASRVVRELRDGIAQDRSGIARTPRARSSVPPLMAEDEEQE